MSETDKMQMFVLCSRCLRTSDQNGQEAERKPAKAKPKLKVPPKLLLALEKDKGLRERLKKYSLSTKGSRQVSTNLWVAFSFPSLKTASHLPL